MRRLNIMSIAPVVATCALLACAGPPGPTGPEGPAGPTGATGVTGSVGATGPAGADGSLRVYGDGSAGSVTVSTNASWTGTPPNAAYNFQFADLTITAGTNLIVPTGSVIRVSGTFTNNGTISVQSYSAGGSIGLVNSVGPGTVQRDAGTGINRSPATFGAQAMGSGTVLLGGAGGHGVSSPTIAASILRPGPAGGGGGAGALSGFTGSLSSNGTASGGTLTIIAGGALFNSGTITADGEPLAATTGSGGGGGGVIVLASRTSVTNSGTINARGGNGGDSGISNGAGGGGGGGIVQLIAPSATSPGTINVGGGTAGKVGAAGSVSGTNSRQGGGGGGGSYGSGGHGGSVYGADPSEASNGSPGIQLIRTGLDPASMF